MADLAGLLPEEWSNRIEKAMRQIEDSLADAPRMFVDAHNDFTPWNIRLRRDIASVFDWEYASHEQLPLFDPLHFVLSPMALKMKAPAEMLRKISETVRMCERWLGSEICYKAKTQALAYLIDRCTLYMWADRGTLNSIPTIVSYAPVIDYLCCTG